MGKGWNSLGDIRIHYDVSHARYSLISDNCIPAFVFPSHTYSHCNFCNCSGQIRWPKLHSELYGWSYKRWIQTQVVRTNIESSCRRYWDIRTSVSNPRAALKNLELFLDSAISQICRQRIRKAQRSAVNFVVCNQVCWAILVPLNRHHRIFARFHDFNSKILHGCLRVK